MSSLTVVVPTFNEAANVGELVGQLGIQLEGVDAEILFVDDSTDTTPAVIRAAAARSTLPIRLLHRPEPTGRLAGAVVAGLLAAGSPWVVVMDGDLQHPPSSVPMLYAQALASGGDVVVASRYAQGGDAAGLDSRLRRVVSTWAGGVAKLLFPRQLAGCSDPMSGFFAVRREAVVPEDITQCGYKVLLALLLHRRLAVSEVPFTFAERHAGQSKASLREGLRYLRLLTLLRTGPALLFALVGLSGVLPNLAAVAALSAAGVPYLVAGALASQVAIVWNFAGAELVVFRDRRAGSVLQRAVRYALVSETDLARLPFVALLVGGLGWGGVPATAATLLAAFGFRYAAATRLVYRRGGEPALVPHAAPQALDVLTGGLVVLPDPGIPVDPYPTRPATPDTRRALAQTP